MSVQTLKPSQIDVSKITFKEPVENAYKGISVQPLYEGKAFRIQTPKIRLAFGLSDYVNEAEKDKGPSYSLDLSLRGYTSSTELGDEVPEIKEFFELIQGMRETLVKSAVKNSMSWLKKPKLIEAVAEELCRQSIRFPMNKETREVITKYPPTLKCKMPYDFKEDRFKLTAVSVKNLKQPLSSEEIREAMPKGSGNDVIVGLRPKVTFNGGQFGWAFEVAELVIFPGVPKTSGINGLDLSGVETPAAEETTDESADSADEGKPSHLVEDSDGEEEKTESVHKDTDTESNEVPDPLDDGPATVEETTALPVLKTKPGSRVKATKAK